jgi:hypothetical protein
MSISRKTFFKLASWNSIVFVSKLVHTTMLEKYLLNKNDSIMLFVGNIVPILSLVLGLVIYSTH